MSDHDDLISRYERISFIRRIRRLCHYQREDIPGQEVRNEEPTGS